MKTETEEMIDELNEEIRSCWEADKGERFWDNGDAKQVVEVVNQRNGCIVFHGMLDNDFYEAYTVQDFRHHRETGRLQTREEIIDEMGEEVGEGVLEQFDK